MSISTQVLIVGGGPTGLSLAAQLIRYGIDFMILEKDAHTTELSKALVVQARTLEIFNEIGLAATAIERGRRATALNIFHKGEKKASLKLSELGNGLSAFPYALSLEQSKTEKMLAEYIEQHNHKILWQSEVTSVNETDDGIVAHYKNANGEDNIVTASYLVGCDGAHSLIRHQADLGFEGETVPRLFYVADVIVESSVINSSELFMFMLQHGFVIFFPMEGDQHYRVIGVLPDQTDVQTVTFDDVKRDITPQMETPLEFRDLKWFSTYKVSSRKAVSFRRGRQFIAGDAAHIHTPAGGQGMNTGIQDAYNLAWKLAFTLRYNAGDILLESYNSERTENAEHLLKTTDRMFDVMAGKNAFWNFLRLNVVPPVANFISHHTVFNKNIFPLISQTGIAYANSALTIKGHIGHVHAGDRMPYFENYNGSNSYSDISLPEFKLLFCRSADRDISIVPDNKGLPVSKINMPEVPEAHFGDQPAFYILLRPDNHIAYIGSEMDTIDQFFVKLFGES